LNDVTPSNMALVLDTSHFDRSLLNNVTPSNMVLTLDTPRFDGHC